MGMDIHVSQVRSVLVDAVEAVTGSGYEPSGDRNSYRPRPVE